MPRLRQDDPVTEDLQVLGQALAELRQGLGLSQGEVAEQIEWHQTEISALENGRRVSPRMDKLVRLGALYGLTPNEVAEIAGWWIGPNAPANDPYWDLLGEIVLQVPLEERQVLLKTLINQAKSFRQQNLTKEARELASSAF